MVAHFGIKENRPLENLQIEPDIKVNNLYEEVLYGIDSQLKAAVKELMK